MIICTITDDFDIVTEISGLVIDLDPVMQELFESGAIENLPFGRDGAVENEFVLGGGGFGGLWLDRKGARLAY